ncbi:unnamed protein product, partial [Heligmosomoides polygyrus]|uniref:Methyltranfer_dom domain-containing protein n=1 Tax=Heligmosomoides polygyrus TaxID=6339 RepID=A0A183GBM7_HELPZ
CNHRTEIVAFRRRIPSEVISTKVSPKKQHEIARLVTTIKVMKQSRDNFDTVVDVGAGIGHLSRVISSVIPSCSVVSVEQNKDAEIAGRRNEDQNVKKTLLVFAKGLLVGLHPCGDLSASILRLFVKSSQLSAVVLVGCCYHKLSVRCSSHSGSSNVRFPLSSMFRDVALTSVGLDLACHANENFIGQLESRVSFNLFYRMRSRGARPALTTFVERVSTLSDSPEATLIIESGALQGVQEVVDYNTGQIC